MHDIKSKALVSFAVSELKDWKENDTVIFVSLKSATLFCKVSIISIYYQKMISFRCTCTQKSTHCFTPTF